jgi:hypothetical protein
LALFKVFVRCGESFSVLFFADCDWEVVSNDFNQFTSFRVDLPVLDIADFIFYHLEIVHLTLLVEVLEGGKIRFTSPCAVITSMPSDGSRFKNS